MYATARDIRRDTAGMLRPPRRVNVSDGARALQIAKPSGSSGSWDPDVAPYMVAPLDSTASRLYEAVIFVGPARSGKTVALIDGRLAYTVTCNPADTLIIQTNKDQAEDFSKTRISRAIKHSPLLAAQLSPRAHDDNVLLKFFRSGMSLRFGWPSLGVLSGKDIHDVLMTDVDNFTGDLSIDEAFGYALKRIQTYMSAGICVAESSPAKDYTDGKWRGKSAHEAPPAPGILALYNRGDRHRWYWPCPECKTHFQAAPGYEGFHLPPEAELLERVLVDDIGQLARRHALLYCPHCHVGLEHKWKKQLMNPSGRWVGDGQLILPDGSIEGERIRSRTASYWLGGVAAAYQSWESLIERYLQALKAFAMTGDELALKATTNVDAAMPYIPMAARSDADTTEMQDRGEEWAAGVIPPGVRFLTAAVDVQANRFVIKIIGWGPGITGALERWVIDWFTLRTSERMGPKGEYLGLEPAKYLEDWDRLIDKVINRRYPLYDGTGRTMPVRAVGIDWGGKKGTSPRALDFWRKLKADNLHRRVRLVKGDKNQNGALFRETYPDSSKRKDRNSGSAGDVPQILINTDRVKDALSANVARKDPGPGYYHFPAWLPTSYYDELTAETRTPTGWHNPAKHRNEATDCGVYNEVIALWIKAPQIDFGKPPIWAAEWDRNPDIVAGDIAPAPQPRARRPRVVRSKYLGR